MIKFLSKSAQPQPIHPKDGSYDFSIIGEAVRHKRVVMLGEPDHGDGAAFALKAKLVEYLHLHCDFNVFAIEADFYALHRAWESTKSVSDILELSHNVYPFWYQDKSMKRLWEFISKRFTTKKPLVVSGFDVRHSSLASQNLVQDLETFLKELDGQISKDGEFKKFKRVLAQLIRKEYQHKVNVNDRLVFFPFLRQLQNLFRNSDHQKAAFWLQEINNLNYAARNAWGFEYRDIGMAENILWLLNKKYPNEKIIVWAHNFHIARDTREISLDSEYADQLEMFPNKIMGNVLSEIFGDNIYSLGLISGNGCYHMGSYSMNYKDEVQITVSEKSLEYFLNAKNHDLQYLDLKNQEKSFLMSGLCHNQERNLNWNKIYDAILYFKLSHGIKIE
jgi:erythromycin esterase